MRLHHYKEKRNFNISKEPKAKISYEKHRLFIIQKHAASHLHYDFRLELNGVLLSWAVPKGPCFDPKVKRLAMHVEDHPVAYGSFEGIIPKGQYGGGTVMLWDKGHWKPLDKNPRKAYEEGHLRFELEAEKLHGRWDLFRFKEDNQWFLVKYKDEYAKSLSDYDVTEEEPLSVLSEQTMEEIKNNYENIWTEQGSTKAENHKKKGKTKAIILPDTLIPAPFPEIIFPQLATLVNKAPEGDIWLHEIKFDGYRMLAFLQDNKVILKSRNQLNWTADLHAIADDIKQLQSKNLVLDGEVVIQDSEGKSNFQLLQNAIKSKKPAAFRYYIFDILYYDDFDLRAVPLIQRKNLLRQLLPENHPSLFYSDHIIDGGPSIFKQSCQLGLEGIISKKADSTYESGRAKSWLKIKCTKRQEFVIGGYSDPQGGRQYFGSLHLGVYDERGGLAYAGKVGTGFTDQSLQTLYKHMQKHTSDKNPFQTKPPGASKIHWVKPVLIAEVEFTEWTADNHLRHPSFKGLRMDKKAKEVVREEAIDMKKNKSYKNKSTFTITNPGKLLFPEDKITKNDILVYYEMVSDYILPFIKDRPLSLVRCPSHYETCFFQRHYNKMTPKALKSIDIESKEVVEPYIYLDNKEGLLSLVQMGVLEIHPWGSTIDHLEQPDILIIDLDPAPDVTWKNIVAAAFDIKMELEAIKLHSFVKTTGGKGLHVVIPIQAAFDWEVIKNFTHVFVEYLEKKNPAKYISKMTKAKRGGKIFVDYLRNQRSATAVSAYSTRSRIHAPVSVPLDWDELTNKREDTAFTIKTLEKRLHSLKQDPWKDFWTIKQSLPLE